jgi:pimeloyl-ACP methyl ester carboxylesterase
MPLAQRVGRRALWRRGAQSQWVETPHGRMHCYDITGTGKLPPVVLLHGLATDATPFGPLLMRLRRDVRRVLAPDHLGHGFSAGHSGPLTPDSLLEATTQTLDALLNEPAIVVGNSLGGAVAVRYALKSPEKVRALILVSPAGAHCEDHEWRELKQVFDMSCRADAALFFRRLYQQPPWFLSLVAHELPAAMASPAVRSLLSGASNATALCPDELAALEVPVLLVWGQADRLLPESHLDYFARHLPTGTQIERPEAFGHSPHIDASQALASLIVRFARGLDAAPVSGKALPEAGVQRVPADRHS